MSNELLIYGGRISGVILHEGCPPFTLAELQQVPNSLAARYEDAVFTIRAWKDYSTKGKRRLGTVKSRRTRLQREIRNFLEESEL